MLVYLIDLASVDGEPPDRQLEVLRTELGAYRPDLLERPSLVLGSKADVLTAADWGVESLVDLEISSVTGHNVGAAGWRMAELVDASRALDDVDDGFTIHRPVPTGFEIIRADDASYRVVGRSAERAVALSDLEDPGALDHARKQLEKLGVNKALRQRGVRDGDIVVIGAFAFEYQEDV